MKEKFLTMKCAFIPKRISYIIILASYIAKWRHIAKYIHKLLNIIAIIHKKLNSRKNTVCIPYLLITINGPMNYFIVTIYNINIPTHKDGMIS